MTILVDAPGSERHFAWLLQPFHQQCYAFFVVNNYELETILPLLELGATGFTARGDPVAAFVKSFLATSKGQIGLPREVTNRAMSALTNNHPHYPILGANLTPRETEILQLLAVGLSNRDIAQKLFLSVRTVEAHLRNLYGKLEVNTRTAAALWAVHHGYEPIS